MTTTHIRVVQNYKQLKEAQLLASTGAAIKGLTGDTVLNTPPVDLKTLQSASDDLTAAIAALPHGGKAATADKNNKRLVLAAMMVKEAHYVQDNCGGDPQVVLNAGFTIALSSRTSAPLTTPSIVKIDLGKTTQLVVKVKPVPRARCYEGQTAALGAGGVLGPWVTVGTFTNSQSMIFTGLTPGTTYSIRVRAIGGSTGSTDYSDPVSHIVV